MNPISRDNLVLKLEHLIRERPVMGTLFMTVRQTPYMLVATLQLGTINLGYPHAGRFDVVRAYRFGRFCKARGFTVRRERWHTTRVSRAAIGTIATDAADTID